MVNAPASSNESILSTSEGLLEMPPPIAGAEDFMRGKVSSPAALSMSTTATRNLSQGPQEFPHNTSVTMDAQALCSGKCLPQALLGFLVTNPFLC